MHAFAVPLAAATPAQDLEPAYNIAPSQNAWVILARDGQAVTERLPLMPGWAKDTKIGYRTVNALLDTVPRNPLPRGVELESRSLCYWKSGGRRQLCLQNRRTA